MEVSVLEMTTAGPSGQKVTVRSTGALDNGVGCRICPGQSSCGTSRLASGQSGTEQTSGMGTTADQWGEAATEATGRMDCPGKPLAQTSWRWTWPEWGLP